MTARMRSILCGVLLVAQALTACTSWQVVQVSPRALVDSAHVRSMRITEQSGLMTVLESPILASDSVIGTTHPFSLSFSRKIGEPGYQPPPMRSIPLAAVAQVAVRKLSIGITLLIPAVVLGVTMALAGSSGGFGVMQNFHFNPLK